MAWECVDCGNTTDFEAPGSMHGSAAVDGHGNFRFWIDTGASDPDIDEPNVCAKCKSLNLIKSTDNEKKD